VLQLAGKAEYATGSYNETLRLDQEALPLAQAANGAESQEVASIEGDLVSLLVIWASFTKRSTCFLRL
jgi:hypothetical protein